VGAVQVMPKFGPPLQMPLGCERQKLGFGCTVPPFGSGWQTLGSGAVVPQAAPLFSDSAQKKPLDVSPMHCGADGDVLPQYASSFTARLQRNVKPGHWLVNEPSGAEQERPWFGPPLHAPLAFWMHSIGSATGGLPTPQLAPSLAAFWQTKPACGEPVQLGGGFEQVTGIVTHSAGGLKQLGGAGAAGV
jgi:hypothetical protein